MRALALLAVVAAGCGGGLQVNPTIPRTATYAFLIPKSSGAWCAELRRGLEDGAKQFQLDYVVRDYSPSTSQAILQAADTLPPLKDGNACIVFADPAPIKTVVRSLRDDGVKVITVGEDEVMSGRIAHVGESSENLAYKLSIRLSQMKPQPKRVLAIISDEPVHKNGIKGALFQRSDQWKRFQLRIRGAEEVLSPATLQWPDVIIAIGAEAVDASANSRATVVPVDGSDETLDGIRSGKYTMAFVPDYYQMGYRAVRLSREHFVQGSIANPTLAVPYKEVDKPTLDWFIKKRFVIPPAVRPRTD